MAIRGLLCWSVRRNERSTGADMENLIFWLAFAVVVAAAAALYLTRPKRSAAAPEPRAPRNVEPPRPAAPALTTEQVRAFLLEGIDKHLDGRPGTYKVSGEKVFVTYADGETALHDLAFMVQLCRRKSAGEIAAYVPTAIAEERLHRQRLNELEGKMSDFEAIRKHLVLRLFPVARWNSKWIARVDIPGTVSVLTFDVAPGCINVPAMYPAIWGKTPDELLDLAADNAFDHPVTEKALGKRATHKGLFSDDRYGPTRAIRLDRHPGAVGEEGAIFAVPNRHALLYHPMDDASTLRVMNLMMATTPKLCDGHAEPTSRHLYWYAKGKAVKLTSGEEGPLRFEPPDEFRQALARLPAKRL